MKKSGVTGIVTAVMCIVIGGISVYQVQDRKNDRTEQTQKGVSVKYTSMLGEEGNGQSSNQVRMCVNGKVKKSTTIILPDRQGTEDWLLATLHVEEDDKKQLPDKEITILIPSEKRTEVTKEKLFHLEQCGSDTYKEDCDGSRIYLSQIAKYIEQ